MTTWTKAAKPSGTTWTKQTKPTPAGLTGGGSPIGLLLALTRGSTVTPGTTWTKSAKPSNTVWTKITKAP